MKVHTLERQTLVPRPLEEVFAFFSDPSNLEAITPPWLRFRILAVSDEAIRAGTLIRYALRVHGLSLRWTSRITRWTPPIAFVDEQIAGPYRLWVHTHEFEPCAGGTRVRDRVAYAPWGGALLDRLFVRRDLEAIFAYREGRLQALLAPAAGT